jgi:hypothetical protein
VVTKNYAINGYGYIEIILVAASFNGSGFKFSHILLLEGERNSFDFIFCLYFYKVAALWQI